jgi:hypothetical protein
VGVANGTFGAAGVRHIRASDTAQVDVVNSTFPVAGELISVAGGAEVRLWNLLRVLVRSYETGTGLAGATVAVFQDDVAAYVVSTDGNGSTASLLLGYRAYRWSGSPSITESTIRILVSLTPYAFEDNNRSFVLAAGRTELVRGSTVDTDADKEPDFSDSDDDNDGLRDDAEALIGTDPLDADSDGDGIPDGWEFDFQQDPLDASDRDADPDGDGLTNAQEHAAGTDPRTADTDGDRLADPWEVRYGFDPNDPSDAAEDADGDGFSNLEEARGGTDPLDPRSFPSGSLGAVWPFLAALVAAVSVIVLALWLQRRGKPKAPVEAPVEDEE